MGSQAFEDTSTSLICLLPAEAHSDPNYCHVVKALLVSDTGLPHNLLVTHKGFACDQHDFLPVECDSLEVEQADTLSLQADRYC